MLICRHVLHIHIVSDLPYRGNLTSHRVKYLFRGEFDRFLPTAHTLLETNFGYLEAFQINLYYKFPRKPAIFTVNVSRRSRDAVLLRERMIDKVWACTYCLREHIPPRIQTFY